MSGQEKRALVKQGWLIASSKLRRKVMRNPDADASVVFVHGFMAGAAVMDPLRRSVSERLGLDTAAFDYPPLASFTKTARRLASLVRLASAGRRVVLVGHSLGGLLARHAVAFEGIEPSLLITMATPHQGTERAQSVPGSLGRALRPRSKALERLAEESTVPHVSIIGAADKVVVPLSSARPEGAQVHTLTGIGHNGLLFHPDVHALVCRSIAEHLSEEHA